MGERLLEFDVAEKIAFRSHEISSGIPRRSLAFGVTSNRVLAARKKAAIEWQILRSSAEGQDHAMTEPQIHPGPVVEPEMVSRRCFEALVVGVTAEIIGADFEIAEHLVAAPGIERIVAAIVAKFRNDRADRGEGAPCRRDARFRIRGV